MIVTYPTADPDDLADDPVFIKRTKLKKQVELVATQEEDYLQSLTKVYGYIHLHMSLESIQLCSEAANWTKLSRERDR